MSSIQQPHDPSSTADTMRIRQQAGSTSDPDPRVGQLIGKYRLIRRLGAGGMGIVYEAVDTVLGRQVAVKLLTEELSADAQAVRRFQREAQSAARLNHPNVVTLFEADQHKGAWFLVMELVGGGSASELLRTRGALPWREATQLVRDACRGLAAAHGDGLIHRDIKPANLLRTPSGVGKLADFGIAKIFGRPVSSITEAGTLAGTPDYMSPEQCKGQHLDERSDLYSLGATYYALLTGQPPYPRETPMQIMFAHCSGPVPEPDAVNPSIPAECAAIVRRAMANDREQRYSSAGEMLGALQALLSPEESGDTQPAMAVFLQPKRQRWLSRWSALALAILLLAVLSGGLAWLASRGEKSPDPPALLLQPLTLKPKKTFAGGKGGVRMARFSRDGGLLAAACADHKARVWVLSTNEERILSGHTAKVLAVVFAPDGLTLFTGSDDKTIRSWELASGKCLNTVPAGYCIYDLSFSPDGQSLVAACGYSGFTVWEYRGPADLRNPRIHPSTGGLLTTVAYTADGRSLLTTPGKHVILLSARTFAEEARLEEADEVCDASFALQGRSIGLISRAGPVKLWEPGTGRPPITLLSASQALRCLAFSPDGSTLALGGAWGGGIQLCHLPTGKTTRITAGLPGAVRTLVFAPDGRMLASANENERNEDELVRLWDVCPDAGIMP